MPYDDTRSSLELLYNVSRELASELDLRTVLQRIIFQSLKSIGGERGSIVVLDDNGKPIDSAIAYGTRIHSQTTGQLQQTMDQGLAGWVVRRRQPVLVSDTSKDERWLRRPDDAIERSGAKSAMCVPLLARERLVGVLTLVHPSPGAYDNDQFELMQAIADLAGVAVLNARLYGESTRQARVMKALAEGAANFNASLRMEEVMSRILNETIQVLKVDVVALALVESNGDLVFRAVTGDHPDIIGRRIPAGRGVVGWVLREGQSVIIPAVREDKHFLAEMEQFTGLEVLSLACAPVFAQGRIIGVLEAINPVDGIFDPDALLVLAGIGNLAGSYIQHAQLFERLQAAHARYRELFDDSIDAIILTNWNGKILETNRQAISLSGFTSKQLSKMSIRDLHQADLSEKGASPDQLKAGRTCSYESILKSRVGRSIPIQVYVRRVAFEESETLQWTLRDITERKDHDQLHEDLTSMIYHDLRSPLANIISGLDVIPTLFQGQNSEALDSVLNITRRSTDRIQRLVSSLLDISRLESGQAIGSQQSASPITIITEAVEAIRPVAESRHQSLTVNLPQKLPSIWVDVDMIRRVLINLLENAAKYTQPEGKIEIGAQVVGESVQVWVLDNGPGIPPAERERIFDKFTRLKNEDITTGLGVGLAFCRLAVHGHGGEIWVESGPDKGAKFILSLPVIQT